MSTSSLGSFFFSSRKRVIGTLAGLILILSIPLTISLVSQQQDVRQRASEVGDPLAFDCHGEAGCQCFGNSQCDSGLCKMPEQNNPPASSNSGQSFTPGVCSEAIPCKTGHDEMCPNLYSCSTDVGASEGICKPSLFIPPPAPTGIPCNQFLEDSKTCPTGYSCLGIESQLPDAGGICVQTPTVNPSCTQPVNCTMSEPPQGCQYVGKNSCSCGTLVCLSPTPIVCKSGLVCSPGFYCYEDEGTVDLSGQNGGDPQPAVPFSRCFPLPTLIPSPTCTPPEKFECMITNGQTVCPIPAPGTVICKISGTPTPTPTLGANQTGLLINYIVGGIGTNTQLGENNNPKTPLQTIQIEILNPLSGDLIDTKTAIAQYDGGVYKASANLGDLPAGQYAFKVRTQNSLWKAIPGIATLVQGTYVPTATPTVKLTTGDIGAQENILNLKDYNLFLACLNGEAICTPAVRQQADFNDDGNIDTKDLNILLRAFATRQGD